jgi:molybdopterin-containing oxidoreductase family membrane subunit
MADERTIVMGVFADDRQAAAAIDALRAAGVAVQDSYGPIPSPAIDAAMRRPKSKVGWFTLVGGIIGFCCGFALAAFCAGRWSLIVGGKPIFAWVPFVIVGFEFTILFAVFGNVAGLLSQARLPRLSPPQGYDPRFSCDRYGVLAACAATEKQRVARLLTENGGMVDLAARPAVNEEVRA